MATFLAFPILGLAAVLQATFVPQIRLLGGGPDLVYVLVLAWAIHAELDTSVFWAFVGGVTVDLLSQNPTGTSTFGMLVMIFSISGLGQQVYRIGVVILIGLVIAGTIVQQLIIMGIMTISGFQVDWLFSMAYIIAPTIFYNLIFIWPAYWFIRRLQRGLERRGYRQSNNR
jgi:rod shape-determining protein MreD